MKKQPTTIVGLDGIEYVVNGGKLVEKCLHKTTTDNSSSEERWVICHDCGKTLIYNKNTNTKSLFETFQEIFMARYGREPKGIELLQIL